MDCQSRSCNRLGQVVLLFLVWGYFMIKEYNSVLLVHEVGKELILLLRYQPLLDVELAHVYLL